MKTTRPLAAGSACVAVLLLTAGLAVPVAQNPPLGELARKEAERRKAQPSAEKVYTNKDLPPSAEQPRAAPAEAGEAPAEAGGVPEPKPAAGPKPETRDEAWWKGRIIAAREELRRNEMFAEALQTRINALGRDFVNRDNPVQRARIGDERAEALNELARVRQDILRGKQQIDDIEEEARKAGVPPGWLR